MLYHFLMNGFQLRAVSQALTISPLFSTPEGKQRLILQTRNFHHGFPPNR